MADTLPEGELFAERYRIERVVGRGGMATVYAAEDIKHHRRVAVILARNTRGLALLLRGNMAESEIEFDAATRLGRGPDQVHGWAGLAEIYFRQGNKHAADTMMMHALSVADTTHPTVHDAAYLAWGFSATGQPERAIRILERYQPRRDMHFQLHLQRDPALDPLRSKPRFRALLTRQNVPLQ